MIILRKQIDGVSERALALFATRASRAVRLSGKVQVLITNDAEMQELNRRFRRKNKPTDVLSFPALDGLDGHAGDIAISADIAAANAARLGHSLKDELKILLLHGILHLSGLDHESDNGQMARKEHKLRSKLNLPDGLIARTIASTPRQAKAGRRR